MSVFSTLVADCLDPAVLTAFGDDVVYLHRGGSTYTLNGVLDSGEVVQEGERVYMTLWAPLTSFTGGEPRKGDTVTLQAVTYRVADVERDFAGGRRLKLAVTNP